jgi:hypothetical protein
MVMLLKSCGIFVSGIGLSTLVACGGGGDASPSNVAFDTKSLEASKSAIALVSSLFSISPTTLTFEGAFKSPSTSYSSVQCPGAGNSLVSTNNPDGMPSMPRGDLATPDSVTLDNLECVLSDTLDSRSALKSKVSGKTTTTLTELSDFKGNPSENYSFKMETNSSQTETFFKFVTDKSLEVPFTGSHVVSFNATTSVSHSAVVDPEDGVEEAKDTEVSVATISTSGQLNGTDIAGKGSVDSRCVRASDGSAICERFNVTWSGSLAAIANNELKDDAVIARSNINISSTVTQPLIFNSLGIPVAGEISISAGSDKITVVFSQDGRAPRLMITTNGKLGGMVNFSDLDAASKKFRF